MKFLKSATFKFILIFVVISLPLITEVGLHYKAKHDIKVGLVKLYKDYCKEDVTVEVQVKFIQKLTILPGGLQEYWIANTTSSKVPHLEGRYGRKDILLEDFLCFPNDLRLNRLENKFEINTSWSRDGEDNGGISIYYLYLYGVVYCLYFLSIVIYVLFRFIKKYLKRRQHNVKDDWI
ncbi:hypothetical protein MH117_21760 [Paenibacillus sp. ACRRX]|uniref:hypothetical protein n=1 Tax=unclassified Paenibacillus TaxID=185978 RepID=UPI001EF59A48|nr:MULTISPECIES: hypothetical protein [unclassified Paenibacillus]MCG7410042.1 hypothetical protein [Paenibacillus sp. ACRRX]MDK8183992.1 hypothetical protein [Paenibacillus sp. UMB4589-SE434]